MAVTVETSTDLSTETVQLTPDAKKYAANARASNTTKAYRGDVKRFLAWCAREPNPVVPLPAEPETVANYISHLANSGLKMATINRALVAISERHRAAGAAGEPNPCRHDGVRTVGRGAVGGVGVMATTSTTQTVTFLCLSVNPIRRLPSMTRF